MWVYFWALYSAPLIHISFYANTIYYSFDYYNFVVLSNILKGYTLRFVLFPQGCFGNSGSFGVPYKFQEYFSSSVKNVMGNLIGITLNLQIALGSMAILTILILPMQEHGISLHFFESSSLSFINVLQFSAYKSFSSLVRFIPSLLFLGVQF